MEPVACKQRHPRSQITPSDTFACGRPPKDVDFADCGLFDSHDKRRIVTDFLVLLAVEFARLGFDKPGANPKEPAFRWGFELELPLSIVRKMLTKAAQMPEGKHTDETEGVGIAELGHAEAD